MTPKPWPGWVLNETENMVPNTTTYKVLEGSQQRQGQWGPREKTSERNYWWPGETEGF